MASEKAGKIDSKFPFLRIGITPVSNQTSFFPDPHPQAWPEPHSLATDPSQDSTRGLTCMLKIRFFGNEDVKFASFKR
jgi:hypothetical protein